MFTFSITSTIVQLLAAYASCSAGSIWWLYRSDSHNLARNATNAIRIATRLGIVFCVIGALCYAASIPPAFVILFCCIIALVGWAGMSFEAALFALPLVGLLYVVQQFVLGFPDRDSWILDVNNNPTQSVHAEADPLIGQHAITASPLRPTGDVRLADGSKRSAITEASSFLDEQEAVMIVSARNRTLIVRPLQKDCPYRSS